MVEIEVPYSTGTHSPQIEIPANACDCHHHIYDPLVYPYVPADTRNQPAATVGDYLLLQKRLGTTRNVIVQPSAYGLNNRCTLDAMVRMGPNTRAVVVVDTKISDEALKQLHDLGVRGIRINLASEITFNKISQIEPLSRRVSELGWHVQFWMKADDIAALEDLLLRLPSSLVFDHLGHIPQPAGVEHPAFRVIGNLLDKGNAWVKLSGAYMDTKIGPPSYADVTKLAQAFIKVAPERMVWGSDWPHPGMWAHKKPFPNDALLLDLLGDWAQDEAIHHRILVENPALLYDFPK
ncbi:MAG: amidohydrolase family protein [Negativicutes bacterium]